MNNRIKDLAIMSGFDLNNITFGEKTRLDCFAKLLVEECINGFKDNYPPDDHLPMEEITGFLKDLLELNDE